MGRGLLYALSKKYWALPFTGYWTCCSHGSPRTEIALRESLRQSLSFFPNPTPVVFPSLPRTSPPPPCCLLPLVGFFPPRCRKCPAPTAEEKTVLVLAWESPAQIPQVTNLIQGFELEQGDIMCVWARWCWRRASCAVGASAGWDGAGWGGTLQQVSAEGADREPVTSLVSVAQHSGHHFD